MSWTSDGSLGSANDKTAGTSIAMTVSATAEVGKVAVVVVALDNNATVDGDAGEVTSVVDSAGGNTWVKAREFTFSKTAANSGATVSVWYCVLATQLTSATHTITANFGHSPGASAITAWEYSISGNSVVVSDGADLGNNTADPGSMNLTTANEERLWVRGIAHEGPVADAFTKSASYGTAFTKDGTTGGGGAGNMSVCGEFDIFTGTSNASDPTWTAVDHASVLVALKETTVHQGAASLSASGVMAAVASAVLVGASALAGAATMAASAVGTFVGVAALTGVATLAAVGDVTAGGGTTHEGAASLSASASVAAAAVETLVGAAVLPGTGTVGAAASATYAAVASLAASGTVNAVSAVTHPGDAALSATASVGASPTLTLSSPVALQASATIGAAAVATYAGAASLQGSATVGAVGTVPGAEPPPMEPIITARSMSISALMTLGVAVPDIVSSQVSIKAAPVIGVAVPDFATHAVEV